MPVTPFIPLISSGIGALFGAKSNSTPGSASVDAQGRALQGQADAAGQASSLSKYLQSQGQYTAPALGRAMSYYDTLLRGGRQAMQTAVAGQAGAITDASKGAAMNLERMGVTGGQKVQAMADLARQTGGQIGQLTVGVQPGAAAALTDIGKTGLNATSGAISGLTWAGSIYANLVRGQQGLESQQFERQRSMGGSLASLIQPALQGLAGRYGGQGGQGGRVTPYQMGF